MFMRRSSLSGAFFAALFYLQLMGCADLSRENPASAISEWRVSERNRSSSSSEVSSSSSRFNGYTNAAEVFLNPALAYGKFQDVRDSQSYATLVLGGLEWMAQNLNYSGSDSAGFRLFATGRCYGSAGAEDSEKCGAYGRLYSWAEAMTVCPASWRLPGDADWNALESALGGADKLASVLGATQGWTGLSGASNSSGLSVLPAGQQSGGEFLNRGGAAYFWTSSVVEADTLYAYTRSVLAGETSLLSLEAGKASGFSVRCVR